MLRTHAVVEFGQPLQIVEQPLPIPKGEEVLIRTTYAGMCHSELHLWEGYFDMGGGNKLARSSPRPHTLGHEIEGEVVATGPNVPEGLFTRGKSYAVFPWFVDGRSIYGGYGSHSLVPSYRYLIDYEGALPEGLGCVYMCSGLTAFSALKKVQRHPGIVNAKDVLLIGLGGLGFQGLGFALPMLGGACLAADIDDSKLEEAQKYGVVTFNSIDQDVVKQIKDASFDGTGIGAVVDFVGNSTTYALGNAVLRKGGKQVIVGLFGGDMDTSLGVLQFPLQARSLEGSFVGSFEEAKEMMDVLRQGKTTVVPHHFQSIHTVNQSLLDLKAGKIIGRRIFKHDWPESKF
eukprot:UC4_evm4s186